VTPLKQKLIERIRIGGPMTVADYMAACLGDPEHGYYLKREPFGRGGDFITAPEVSQMFGELIGLWAVSTWQAMGSPRSFILAELGSGRGTLIADALRAGRIRPDFVSAAAVHLVETSPRLRVEQKQRLAASGVNVAWHDDIATLPAGPAIVIANEFFDALPIRQFVMTDKGWAERCVGLSPEEDLTFGLRPGSFVDRRGKPGDLVETADPSTAIVARLSERLVASGGAALIVDYGYEGPAVGDTLQAVRAHRYADPLADPGEADLTAHVDFSSLAAAARAAGAVPRRLITQGEFLGGIGLADRAARLAEGKDPATQGAIAAAVDRLAGPGGMGTLFKVLALSSPGLALPWFDDQPAGQTTQT
jgi:NADH dehydrogenase [ubiquinone] 1 alpha subcomplex assembly factor 7